MTTTEAWPFHPNYRVDLPPTQIKSAVERCKKKHIVDLSSLGEETLAVITQVHLAYSKKKERARAASSKSRAAKSAEAPAIDDVFVEHEEVAVEPEAACVVCEVVAEVVAEPPIVAEPPAPPTKAAKTRADNVAPEAVQKKPVEAPAPVPKRAASEAPPARRRGGLAAMVAEVTI